MPVATPAVYVWGASILAGVCAPGQPEASSCPRSPFRRCLLAALHAPKQAAHGRYSRCATRDKDEKYSETHCTEKAVRKVRAWQSLVVSTGLASTAPSYCCRARAEAAKRHA